MIDNRSEFTSTISSFGGYVADLLGTLRQVETGVPYDGSLNPDGNPFQGIDSPAEMINKFTEVHKGIDNLEILERSLDSFYGVKPGEKVSEKLPEVYTEAKKSINEQIIAKRTGQQK
ncbi:MAG: hypothetical protein PHR98_02605 [Candidatus Shapirobacteria bacterium]|jgi:hypothetical protein|nr:hypothetical protein [Candidatus Shapirobacteria bacterium]